MKEEEKIQAMVKRGNRLVGQEEGRTKVMKEKARNTAKKTKKGGQTGEDLNRRCQGETQPQHILAPAMSLPPFRLHLALNTCFLANVRSEVRVTRSPTKWSSVLGAIAETRL